MRIFTAPPSSTGRKPYHVVQPNCLQRVDQWFVANVWLWEGDTFPQPPLRGAGVCQETCRDFGHMQMGFGACVNAAETAFIQGVDLYGEQVCRRP